MPSLLFAGPEYTVLTLPSADVSCTVKTTLLKRSLPIKVTTEFEGALSLAYETVLNTSVSAVLFMPGIQLFLPMYFLLQNDFPFLKTPSGLLIGLFPQ